MPFKVHVSGLLVRLIFCVLAVPSIFDRLFRPDTCTKPIRRGIGVLGVVVTGNFDVEIKILSATTVD